MSISFLEGEGGEIGKFSAQKNTAEKVVQGEPWGKILNFVKTYCPEKLPKPLPHMA